MYISIANQHIHRQYQHMHTNHMPHSGCPTPATPYHASWSSCHTVTMDLDDWLSHLLHEFNQSSLKTWPDLTDLTDWYSSGVLRTPYAVLSVRVCRFFLSPHLSVLPSFFSFLDIHIFLFFYDLSFMKLMNEWMVNFFLTYLLTVISSNPIIYTWQKFPFLATFYLKKSYEHHEWRKTPHHAKWRKDLHAEIRRHPCVADIDVVDDDNNRSPNLPGGDCWNDRNCE